MEVKTGGMDVAKRLDIVFLMKDWLKRIPTLNNLNLPVMAREGYGLAG